VRCLLVSVEKLAGEWLVRAMIERMGQDGRRPMELAAACVDSRRRQRRVLQTLERIQRRFLQAGVHAGVARLTGDWRLRAALPVTQTETRVSVRVAVGLARF